MPPGRWETGSAVCIVCMCALHSVHGGHRPAVTPCGSLLWFPFQTNGYSGLELTLLDPSCKATMNGTHFVLESPLDGCGTRHRRSAPDGVVYYNSVSILGAQLCPVLWRRCGTSLWKWRDEGRARCQFLAKRGGR